MLPADGRRSPVLVVAKVGAEHGGGLTMWHRFGLVAFAIAFAIGCGDDPSTPPLAAGSQSASSSGGGGGAACAPGEVDDEAGGCTPAGLPLGWETPGPTRPHDAGVPPDACTGGFEPDGDFGCVAVLPPSPCPPGQIAIPGDPSCREIAPCGAGTWGDIPVDASTQFVDAAYAGGDSDGSAAKPWTTVQQAIDAASPFAIVAIAAGSYQENLVVDSKPVRLWGRCPAQVEIVGPDAVRAIHVIDAPGTEVRDLAVRGSRSGIVVDGSPGVRLERLWVHDTGAAGIAVRYTQEPAVTVAKTLVEGAADAGLLVLDSAAAVETSAIRASLPGELGEGQALQIQSDVGPTHVFVRGSLLTHHRRAAIALVAADLELQEVAILDTLPGTSGNGIGLAMVAGSSAVVVGSVIERAGAAGIFAQDSTIEVDAVSIRQIGAGEVDEGMGIGLFGDRDAAPLSRIQRSLIERVQDAGICVVGGEAEVESVRVRDMEPTPEQDGWGIFVSRLYELPASARIESSVVERCQTYGVVASGADVTMAESIVSDTRAHPTGRIGSAGVLLSYGGVPAKLDASHSAFLRNAMAGIAVLSSSANVRSSVVSHTTSPGGRASAGVVVVTEPALAKSSIGVDGCLIEESDDFGLVALGADVSMNATLVRATHVAAGRLSNADGISIQPNEGIASTGIIRSSVVEQSDTYGIFAWAAAVTIEGTVVRDSGNIGIVAAADPETAAPTSATIRGSLVERSGQLGVAFSGSEGEIEGTAVRSTAPAPDGKFGRGIGLQASSSVVLRHVEVTDCHDIGVHVVDSTGRIEDVVVEGTKPRLLDGATGDGIVVQLATEPVEVVRSRIANSARVGIASFGSSVTVSETTLECNPIPMIVEDTLGIEASFYDGGNVVCSCDDTPKACTAVGTELAPPEPLATPETSGHAGSR